MAQKVLTKFQDLIINIAIIIVGIAVAIGVFAILRNLDQQKERESLLPRSRQAYKNQEYSQAINLFLRADKEFPDNIEVKRALAELYFLKGKYDDSLKYFNTLGSANLNQGDYQKIGEIYFQQSNFDKVIETWRDKTLEPRYTYRLAKLYYDKNMLDEYIAELGKLPEYREPVVLSQVRQSNLSTIVSETSRAINLPAVSDDNLNLELFSSQIQEAKKQADLGKKDFSDLTQISAFSNLNECKLLTNKIAAVRASLSSKKIPTFQVDYYEGNCKNQIGEPDTAIPLLENAIKSDSTIIEYREALAKSYFLKKDPERVKQIYNEVFTIQKLPTYYQNLAVYLYKLDQIDEALTAYDSAFTLATNPSDKEKIALTIVQINLRDRTNLEICKRTELLDVMKTSSLEQILMLGHCNIYNGKGIDDLGDKSSLTFQYLNSLAKKDRKEIDRALDKDPDGMITTYFKAVGVKLLR